MEKVLLPLFYHIFIAIYYVLYRLLSHLADLIICFLNVAAAQVNMALNTAIIYALNLFKS